MNRYACSTHRIIICPCYTNKIISLESQLAVAREALKKCMKIDQAQEVLRKHNFVFDDLDERWQKLAFTYYSDICEIEKNAKDALEEIDEHQTAQRGEA